MIVIGNGALTWLEKVAELEDVATTVMPDTRRAIEDARF